MHNSLSSSSSTQLPSIPNLSIDEDPVSLRDEAPCLSFFKSTIAVPTNTEKHGDGYWTEIKELVLEHATKSNDSIKISLTLSILSYIYNFFLSHRMYNLSI